MKNLFLLISLFYLMSSCTKEMDMPETKRDLKSNDERFMSMEKLQEIASAVPFELGDASLTKSTDEFIIKEIVPLNDYLKPITKSVIKESGFNNIYVVNYDNNKGYAIISSDHSVGTIAYASEGSDLKNDISDPGMAMLIENIPNYIKEVSVNFLIDSIDPGGGGGGGSTGYHRDSWELVSESTSQPWSQITLPRYYTQGPPFNSYCPTGCNTTSNGRALAGSAAVALAQIMERDNKPETFHYQPENRVYSFVNGSLSPDQKVQARYKLLHQLGLTFGYPYQCNYNADFEGGGNLRDIRGKLSIWGYRHDGYVGYNIGSVETDLLKGRPVMVRGASSTSAHRHIWLITGFAQKYRNMKKIRRYYDSSGNYLREEVIQTKNEFVGRLLTCVFGNSGSTVKCMDNWMVNGSNTYTTNVDMLRNVRPDI